MPKPPPFTVAASGPLPCNLCGGAHSHWLAVPKYQVPWVPLGPDLEHHAPLVERMLRVSWEDPPWRPVMGPLIDTLYRAADAHPRCEILVCHGPLVCDTGLRRFRASPAALPAAPPRVMLEPRPCGAGLIRYRKD